MNWRNRAVGILMCVIAAGLQPSRAEKLVIDTDKLDPQMAETLRKGDARTISEREARRAVERSESAARSEKAWEESSPSFKVFAVVIAIAIVAMVVVAFIVAPQALAAGLIVASCEA